MGIPPPIEVGESGPTADDLPELIEEMFADAEVTEPKVGDDGATTFTISGDAKGGTLDDFADMIAPYARHFWFECLDDDQCLFAVTRYGDKSKHLYGAIVYPVSDLKSMVGALFSYEAIYDHGENLQSTSGDPDNLGVGFVSCHSERIDDILDVLKPYLRKLRLECSLPFGRKWLVLLAGGRLHYVPGQVVWAEPT